MTTEIFSFVFLTGACVLTLPWSRALTKDNSVRPRGAETTVLAL